MVEATTTPTAMPEAATEPAMTVSSASLHIAVTPLPQDTFFPWLATSSGHLPFRPIFENLATISPETGVSTISSELGMRPLMERAMSRRERLRG